MCMQPGLHHLDRDSFQLDDALQLELMRMFTASHLHHLSI